MLSKEELQEMIVVYGNNHNACRAARELLSLREQYKSQSNELTAMTAAAQALRDEMYKCDAKLDALAALSPVAWRNRFTGYLHSNKPGIVDDFYDELFTAAKPIKTPVTPPLIDVDNLSGHELDYAKFHNNAIAMCSIAIRQAGYPSECSATFYPIDKQGG